MQEGKGEWMAISINGDCSSLAQPIVNFVEESGQEFSALVSLDD